MTDAFNEFEDHFQKIDSELDAVMSSLQNDANDDAKDTSDVHSSVLENSILHTSLAEKSAAQMLKIVKTLQEQQQEETTGDDNYEKTKLSAGPRGVQMERGGSGDKSNKTEDQSRVTDLQDTTAKGVSLFHILSIVLPIVLAVVIGVTLKTSSTSAVVSTIQSEGTIQYQERRKIERCRYNAYGEKYCESEEHSSGSSSSTTNGRSNDSNNGYHRQATFQKCRYINGESYCETYERQLSMNGDHAGAQNRQQQLPPSSDLKNQLASEFRTADANQDGLVGRSEFERYKKLYLQQYPDVSPSSFAQFQDFDQDSNGWITVKEHEGYYQALGLL